MKRSVAWSQIVCWVGAGLDAVVAALLTWPKFGVWIYGLDAAEITPLASSVTGMAAALMWGWAALLLWASFKRSARRDVLIITVVPVMAGLIYNAWLDYSQRSLRGVLGTWVMMILEALLIIFLLYGIWQTWRESRVKPAVPETPAMPSAPLTPQPIQPVAPVAPVSGSGESGPTPLDG